MKTIGKIGRIGRIGTIAALCALTVACGVNDDLYSPAQKTEKVANTFDFSTSQQVSLTIDYSAFDTHGAVFFSVYDENPLVVTTSTEGLVTRELKEGVTPIFESYTDNQGRFSRSIQLPAYAQHLYIVTGDFFVAEPLMEAEVNNGIATATAQKTASTRAITRNGEDFSKGEQTNDLTNLAHLWSTVDLTVTKENKIVEAIYKPWVAPLGTWDSYSGRPSYVMTEAEKAANPKLVFSEEETNGLFEAVKKALNVNKTCAKEFITQADLELVKESEVSLTMLGGNTCWHSSLGYYYYTGDAPSKENLNIIMLFPNTQNGNWTNGKGANNDYHGNVGVQDGDVVQLKYYPNIASGDVTTVSDKFPAGTKIGFILRTNAWGMQPTLANGKKFYVEMSYGPRKYNVWAASTDGISYCGHEQKNGDFSYVNPTGACRTAKFAYTSEKGSYAIVSFEDACNDINYSDVIFSLKPLDAFQKLPDPEDREVIKRGVYAFEDLWPKMGDYDMNDAIVDFKHVKQLHKEYYWPTAKLMKQTFCLTTDQNYVTLKSGLALTLDTKVNPTSIVMKKVKGGKVKTVQFATDGDVYLLTDDFKGECGTEYVLELNYADGIDENDAASVKPFLYRAEADGKRWEVHIVNEEPTANMNRDYLGSEDDCSDPDKGLYFVSDGDYPFAFFLDNADISVFKSTILKSENERKPIDTFFSDFIKWSKSKGQECKKWYVK